MVEESQVLAHRAAVAERFALVICCVCAASTIIRPAVAPLDIWFTYLGVVNTGLAFVVYQLIAKRWVEAHAPTLVLGVAILAVLPVLAVSGGVNSQITPLVSLFPFLGWLLDGRQAAIRVAVFWVACVVLALSFAQLVPNTVGEFLRPFAEPMVLDAKTTQRGCWLLVAIGLATYFSCQFDSSFSLLREQLVRQASEDPLTGLSNRRTLDEHLPQALRRAQRQQGWLSLLVVDVDNFKQLNDTKGHAVGDACLVRLAQVLRSQTRQGQDLVARFGGEEFIVLLESTDIDGAAQVAEHIRVAVAKLEMETEFTVTIGVASTDGGNLECGVDELLHAADAAMYQGKANGRNRVELSAIQQPVVSTS